MIVATLVLTALAQGPQANWAESGHDPGRPDAVVVTGSVELSPAKALDEAKARAVEQLRDGLRERAHRRVEARRPMWLPGFVGRNLVEKWLTRVDPDDTIEIVDRIDRVRDHAGIGRSYQTVLLVEAKGDDLERALRRLERSFAHSREWFLITCGGTVVLWGVLALGYAWLDRLTRGYMSWRLRLLFTGLGVALPSIAFLAV